MQSSRDSSVWRSLAVAFGDGLAFGVGVKLSQSAASLTTGAPAQQPEPAPLAGRLEELERRLAQIEETKALPPPSPPAFDRKAIEAVVNALDARLKEQSAAVERRLVELEAKVTAELQALRQQDHAIASAVEAHMEELQDHFIAQVEAVRLQVEQDRAAMQQEVACAVKAASSSAVQESLAPFRAEAATKDREIAELRQRLEESDQGMLQLLNGLGDVIRQSAGRRAAPTPPTVAEIPAKETPSSAPAAALIQRDSSPEPEPSLPAFAQAGKAGRLWRVPLVSSMVMAAASLVMAHYL